MQERSSRQIGIVRCSQNANGESERRVVVTGMGVVSCLGHDPETFYNSLLEVSIAIRLAVLQCWYPHGGQWQELHDSHT